jgi:hypothetical protein
LRREATEVEDAIEEIPGTGGKAFDPPDENAPPYAQTV